MAALGAKKALNVVDHTNTYLRNLRKMGYMWIIKAKLYEEFTSKVKLKERYRYNREFSVKQGIRQEGITSTSDYKLYVNGAL